MKEELLKGLNEEQIAKVKACKNKDDILALAKEEGVELTNEQLEAVSGGACTSLTLTCPWCGSYVAVSYMKSGDRYYCERCSTIFLRNGEILSEGYKRMKK